MLLRNTHTLILGRPNNLSTNAWLNTKETAPPPGLSSPPTFKKEKRHSFEDENVPLVDRKNRWFEMGVKEAINVKLEQPSGGNLRHQMSATYNAVGSGETSNSQDDQGEWLPIWWCMDHEHTDWGQGFVPFVHYSWIRKILHKVNFWGLLKRYLEPNKPLVWDMKCLRNKTSSCLQMKHQDYHDLSDWESSQIFQIKMFSLNPRKNVY